MLSSEFSLRERRTRVILQRSVNADLRSWATSDGELVRVYAIKARPRCFRLPEVEILGAREFHAEHDVEEAHASVAEFERRGRPDLAATALAGLLNAPRAPRDTIAPTS